MVLLTMRALADEFGGPGDPTGGFGGGPGIPGIFVAFFVFVVLLGIGTTIWRVSTARRIAERAGMDPDDATAVALLDRDGLAATYLGAGMRGRRPQPVAHPVPPPRPGPTVAERLVVLDQLRDAGSVTDEEYRAERQRILGSL